MTTTTPRVDYVNLANALADVTTAYNRTQAWLDLCDAVSARTAAGMDRIEAQRPLTNKRPPSKTHKHRMYDNAYRLLGLTRAAIDAAPQEISAVGASAAQIARATMPLPESLIRLEDIGRVIDVARYLLRNRVGVI